MRTIRMRWALAIAVMAALAGAMVDQLPSAQGNPVGNGLRAGYPEAVGMSTERLRGVNDVVDRHVAAGSVSGAVTLVARNEQIVHFEAHGLMDLASKKPMTKDTIFRIASMTKLVTSVAVMMLVESQLIALSDPVSKFIPAFKDMKVAKPKGSANADVVASQAAPPPFDLVTASREITIGDLLRQTAGLMTVGGIGAQQAVKTTPKMPTDTLASYVPRLAGVPLDFQPGTRWSYSALAGPEVLGRIVEIASGQAYDQFLKTRLFDPLGMTDTFFYLPEDRQSRLVTLYEAGPNGLRQRVERVSTSTGVFFGAGAGLLSTANDYARFAQMLLNGGTFNGRRLLSPATVQVMGSNQVGDMYARNSDRPAPGMGYGLLFGVVEDPNAAGVRVSAGSFGWGGTFGTHVRIDTNQKLLSILMIQAVPVALQLQRDFEAVVMDAIVK